MAHIRGLLKGPKFNGRHSTVIPSAIAAVEAARDCQHVTKIGLGVITPIKSGPEHLKFTPVSGGLKMQVRGAHAVQVFWLYTGDYSEVGPALGVKTHQWVSGTGLGFPLRRYRMTFFTSAGLQKKGYSRKSTSPTT